MGKKLKIEKSKKKEKWNVFNVASPVLDKDLLKGAHIELFYNNQAVIDGCLGVYEYNDCYLKLKLENGALILSGKDFDIVTFEERMMTVKGKIDTLEFCV